jgi:hypothetical protein
MIFGKAMQVILANFRSEFGCSDSGCSLGYFAVLIPRMRNAKRSGARQFEKADQ